MSATAESLRQAYAALETTFKGPLEEALIFGHEMVDHSGLATTDEGRSVLKFCFATALLLRPILRDPVKRASLHVEMAGGDSYNPHFQIDLLPGALAESTWRHTPFQNYTTLFLEEKGFIALGNKRKQRYVIADPIDCTSSIGTGLRDQTSGAVVCNERGEFMAGGIASLVDNTILFIEDGQNPKLLNVNEQRGTISEFLVPQKTIHEPLRYQTLPRRFETMPREFVEQYRYPSLPTIGGWAVLQLVFGTQDFIIDLKGQPMKEGANWYNVAREYGFPVTYPDGKPIDLPPLVLAAVRKHDMNKRVPAVISRTAEIHRRVVPIPQVQTTPLIEA